MRICIKENLSYRELKDKIKTHEYQRLDNKTKSKLISKEKTNITDFVKNPIVIESNGEEIVCFYNITNKSVYAPNIITYIRNIDYYKNLYYNNSVSKKESDYYLAMLASTSFKELYNILKSFLNKKERDRIMKDVIKLSMNMSFNEQELNNLRKEVEMMKEIYYKEKGHTEGLKQGIKEGIEQGAKENSIQIAKKLLKQGIDEEIIITTTNISKEELEKIKEN